MFYYSISILVNQNFIIKQYAPNNYKLLEIEIS